MMNFSQKNFSVIRPTKVCLLLLFLILIFPSYASAWGTMTIDKAVTRLARDLTKQGELKGAFVLISSNDLCDSETGLSLPLANLLRGKLITAMKKNGVRVLLPGVDEDSFMLLQGTWKTQGENLSIDMKVIKLTDKGPETISSASILIPMTQIEAKLLVPDREAWARYLVRQMELKVLNKRSKTLNIEPFKGRDCADGFKHYLVSWLRPALADSTIFIPLEQGSKLRGISVETLRTRGTRGITLKQDPSRENHSLTTNLLDADMELKGVFYKHTDHIEIQARIIDRKGLQVTAASVDVPIGLFPSKILQCPVYSQSGQSTASYNSSSGISVNGLKIELTTTRGDGNPYYKKDEEIRFLMRLNRPAWVYLFNFNSDGEAVLLYPVDKNGLLAKGSGYLRTPEKPLILPDDGCSYTLIASEPFGVDRILAIAVETPMNMPTSLQGKWAQADYLLEQLRSQGVKRQDGYAEAHVEMISGE